VSVFFCQLNIDAGEIQYAWRARRRCGNVPKSRVRLRRWWHCSVDRVDAGVLVSLLALKK